MAYYKNHRSPRFEKMSEVRQWLEGQEKIRHKGENIDHPDRKWSFEGNYLTVEMKVIEDPQAALHVEAGEFARLASKQKKLVGGGYVRQQSLYFQRHRGPSRITSGL